MIKFFLDIKKYRHYAFYSAKSELKSEVANSYLNWIWWILEPLCFMGIYAFVFSFFFKGKIPYLTPFIFIGITMWEYFNKMLKTSVKLVRSKKSIVANVYLPKYILILEKMVVNAFKTSINFVIVIILMVICQVAPTFNILWCIPILISFLVFTFGVCSVFLHFGVYIEDLANITNIALRLLFYMTGVFYNLADKVTGDVGYYLVRCNPLALYLSAMRDCLLNGSTPNLAWLGIWTLAGLIFSVIGIKLIQKNENNYVKVI